MPQPHSVCPWWLGYVLASPIRRLIEPPERLLASVVKPGMTVVEPGCGMGYFSLPLARLVGPAGKAVCVDLQERMIGGLLRRARRAGLADRIVARVCSADDLGLAAFSGSADLALAIHMVHEVPDPPRLLRQLHDALRPGGRLLIVEPRGHVSAEAFEETLAQAGREGFARIEARPAARGRAALLVRPERKQA